MSKNELTVEKEKTLGQRLGFTSQSDFIAEDIFVSKYGTVNLTNVKSKIFGPNNELTFTNFIKTINKRINNNIDEIKYDKETNSFYIVSKVIVENYGFKQEIKEAHKIDIDEESMKDYVDGKYDKYTSILHNLCIESEQNKKRNEIEKAKTKEKNEIIEKANNSHIDLTPLEAKTYLDHLQKDDKTKAKDIAINSAKLAVVAGIPLGAGAICAAMGIAYSAPVIYTAIATLLGTTMGSISEGLVNMIIDDSNTMDLLPIRKAKELIDRIKTKYRELRLNKEKERELKKIKYVDKIVMPNSVTIEERNPIEQLELKDNIMNEIDSMVDKVAYLNIDDRSIILTELKELLNEYIERKTAIVGQDNKISQGENESLIKLRNDICKKLAKIEINLNNVKIKDTKKKTITDEGKLLANKIDKVNKLEPKNQDELNKMFPEEKEEESIKISAK